MCIVHNMIGNVHIEHNIWYQRYSDIVMMSNKFQLLVLRNLFRNSVSAKLIVTNEHELLSNFSLCMRTNRENSEIIFTQLAQNRQLCDVMWCDVLLRDGIINFHWKRVINFLGKSNVIDAGAPWLIRNFFLHL